MNNHTATIVVDLGFGDAGKGTIVDFLCRMHAVGTVVRFNGGAQAAHRVVTPDGREHVFSQFGSGTFMPSVRTHLSRFMLVEPSGLVSEAHELQEAGCSNVFERLTIDEGALVITPFHAYANQIRESLRGNGRHGSCGMGIGETMADSIAFPDTAIHARDLKYPVVLREKLYAIRDRLKIVGVGVEDKRLEYALEAFEDADAPDRIARLMHEYASPFTIVPGSYLGTIAERQNLVFEGAQGVLLDEWYGFHPYTTWSTTTPANAMTLLSEVGYAGDVLKYGLLRAYFTRHGAGPFPTECEHLTDQLPDPCNTSNQWQRGFRVGWFDAVLARYAIAVSRGIDALVITNTDRFASVPSRKICTAYDIPDWGRETDLAPKQELTDLEYQSNLTSLLTRVAPVYEDAASHMPAYLDELAHIVGVPIRIESAGPSADEKRFCV